jgi:hypothetical protein
MTLYFNPQHGLNPILIDKDGHQVAEDQISKRKLLMLTLKESFLKNETRPFIIFNGTHYIDHLEKLFLNNYYKKILQEKEIAFYFFEPLTHYENKIKNPRSAGHILRINNESHEIENIRCLELDSISQWVEQNNMQNLIVYCADYNSWHHYKKFYTNLNLRSADLFAMWWVGRRLRFLNKSIPTAKTIQKKFWSGAWRYDPSRHFITAYLASQDLTLSNNVSFFFKTTNEDFKKKMWFNWKEFELKHVNLSKNLLTGNLKLQNQVPLSIEIDKPVALDNISCDPGYIGDKKNIRKTHDPSDSYRESFCAIVQESRVTQPWPYISEKTLNAIGNFRPFIIVGAPKTLSMLKEMGFKTFDQWWDESYDDVTNNTDRLAKICEIISYINSFSLAELKILYNEMKLILIHNEKTLANIIKFHNKINKRLDKKFKK